MKFIKYVGVVSALSFLAGCGVTSSVSPSTPADSVQIDSTTPAVTTGAKCASAARSEFTPQGKKISSSQVLPGTYNYSESSHLYIAENKADGTVIEGHVSDVAKDNKEAATVDCQTAENINKAKSYSDDLRSDFALKIVVDKDGNHEVTGHRFVTLSENQGSFQGFGADDPHATEAVKVSADDLKKRDAANQTTPNQKLEFWMTKNGDLYVLYHAGVTEKSKRMGTVTITHDSVIYYKRAGR